jgi:hypothetical protein
MPEHTIAPGETVAYLAELHGLSATAIWAHPLNQELRSRRRRLDALAPGDAIHLPERMERVDICATDRLHRFRRVGTPARIRLQFRAQGEPRAMLPFILEVSGLTLRGASDADGVIEVFVPASAREGRLRLGDADAPSILLRLGGMAPDDTILGVRKRLANMGIAAPNGDNLASPEWKGALAKLQGRLGVKPTALLDQATIDALREWHDRVGKLTDVL